MKSFSAVQTTNDAASDVRTRLKSMDAENKHFQAKNPNSSEARIRSNMHGTLVTLYKALRMQDAAIDLMECNLRVDRPGSL